MQYRQLFVVETARAMISFVSTSSRPGFMIALARVQQISRCSGLEANARQKFGTQSIFLVALISSKIALTLGLAVDSSTRFTVGMSGSFRYFACGFAVRLASGNVGT